MKHIPYFLIFIVLLFSCGKDEMMEEMPPDEPDPEEVTQTFDVSFSSEGSYYSSESFIVLSDDDGKTLFDTSGIDLDIEIQLEIDTGTVVNATVGYVKDEQFSIVSYSDIKTESVLNLSQEWETHPCFQNGPVDGRKATLYITDLEDFYETFNPISKSDYQLALQGDTLVLEGNVPSVWDGSYQIAVRESMNSELKSIIIPKADWTWVNETQSMHHTVSFDDFSATNEYVIDLNRLERWNIEAEICDDLGRNIPIQSPLYHSEPREAQQVSIYLNHTIDVNELKLTLSSTNYPTFFTYNWIHQAIPDKLNLVDIQNPYFEVLNVNEFEILHTFQYNLNVLNYEYFGDYRWAILSKGGENVRFVKPKLPEELHEKYLYLGGVLNNPYGVSNTLFKTENIDDITKMHKSIIPRNQNNSPDFNYSSSYRSFPF